MDQHTSISGAIVVALALTLPFTARAADLFVWWEKPSSASGVSIISGTL